MSDMGLFPMRKHHRKEYNIFKHADGFEGRVFDINRRVYCKTKPYPDIETAIKAAKADCELYAKGMCVIGILVDEGKPIRVKEEKEYLMFKKEMRKKNKEGI
jgi:uncharacterized protein involved in tellurium resistance